LLHLLFLYLYFSKHPIISQNTCLIANPISTKEHAVFSREERLPTLYKQIKFSLFFSPKDWPRSCFRQRMLLVRPFLLLLF
jgi:hypothetical protein